jgi:hypothetical protein
MRITERTSPAGVSGTGQSARVAGAGARFTLGDTGAAARTAGPQAAMPAAGLDGLLAVQAAGGQIERRQRAIVRGRGILDSLDRLKIALLSGDVSQGDLLALRGAVMRQRDGVDDPELEELLGHIELRAEVEIAKLAKRGG